MLGLAALAMNPNLSAEDFAEAVKHHFACQTRMVEQLADEVARLPIDERPGAVAQLIPFLIAIGV